MATSKLSKIKALLGMQEEITLMAEAKLKDGTVIGTDAEDWAVGVLGYVVTEEGDKMPLPTGDFQLEDGRVIVIADGTVTEIIPVEAIEEEVVEEVVEASVSKKELIAVLEELSKDFDTKMENLAKELSGNFSKLSAATPVHKKSNLNQVQKVEVQKPLNQMNAAERAMNIFSKSSKN